MIRPTVVALGGNAISPAAGSGTAAEQTANIHRTMEEVAEFAASDTGPLVLTHGNGPQVGNVLLKNDLARSVVPPVPLDWCVAQTQATIGFTIASTLGHELGRRGLTRPVVPVVSRVLVSTDDPAWEDPTKPIGRWTTDAAEVDAGERRGHRYVHVEGRGWRRVVPSPQPIASVDLEAIELLLSSGAIVVANGGGGIPVVKDGDRPLRGVEAVVDKDLSAALVAEELNADRLAILTDVPGVAIGYATAGERWLGEVALGELEALIDELDPGSIGPKVRAVCRFVRRTRGSAVIAALDDLGAALEGAAGTRVAP